MAPLNKQDMTTKLVEAAGAKLSEIAASPVIASAAQSPAISHSQERAIASKHLVRFVICE